MSRKPLRCNLLHSRHQWDQEGASSYRALTEGAHLFTSFPILLPSLPSCSPWESFVRKSLCLNPHLKSASRKTHLRHWFTAAAQRNVGSLPPRSSIYLSASGISGIWEHISPGMAPAPLFLFLQARLVCESVQLTHSVCCPSEPG